MKGRAPMKGIPETYDRAFYAHALPALCARAEGLLRFDRELLPNDSDRWKNYLFERI